VVRVANTGWTRVYLPDGSVRGEIPWFTTEAETVEVPLYSHLTFQTRVGDFLGWLCLVCLGFSLLISRERIPEEARVSEEEEGLGGSTKIE
jgi:apolipoprotein N-acyltransferase